MRKGFLMFEKSRSRGLLVWFLASLFYCYICVLRVLPNVLMSEIMGKFDVNSAIFGQFSGIYYIAYAGFHVPLGLALDRIGVRRLLPICMFIASIGLLSLVVFDSWIGALIGRFLVGFGSSAAILGVFKVIRMLFPKEHFTKYLGYSVSIGLLGSLYGGQPIFELMKVWHWQGVVLILSAFGCFLAITSFVVIPTDKPICFSQVSVLQSLLIVTRHPSIVLICLCGGFDGGSFGGVC